MQITRQADYAVRAVLYLAKLGPNGRASTAQIAREQKIPYLGICLGMQMAVADFARTICGMEGANSTEFDPETQTILQ